MEEGAHTGLAKCVAVSANSLFQIVVCIIADGRKKINSRTLSVIASIGAYQDGVAKNTVNDKPVTAHIYEYTSQSWFVFHSSRVCTNIFM